MKCPNCRTENKEGAKFCIECGAKLELRSMGDWVLDMVMVGGLLRYWVLNFVQRTEVVWEKASLEEGIFDRP